MRIKGVLKILMYDLVQGLAWALHVDAQPTWFAPIRVGSYLGEVSGAVLAVAAVQPAVEALQHQLVSPILKADAGLSGRGGSSE